MPDLNKPLKVISKIKELNVTSPPSPSEKSHKDYEKVL